MCRETGMASEGRRQQSAIAGEVQGACQLQFERDQFVPVSTQANGAAGALIGLVHEADLHRFGARGSAAVDHTGKGAKAGQQQRPPAQVGLEFSHHQPEAAGSDAPQECKQSRQWNAGGHLALKAQYLARRIPSSRVSGGVAPKRSISKRARE